MRAARFGLPPRPFPTNSGYALISALAIIGYLVGIGYQLDRFLLVLFFWTAEHLLSDSY